MSGLYDFIYIKFQNANSSMVTESRQLPVAERPEEKREESQKNRKTTRGDTMPIILIEVTASEVYTCQISSPVNFKYKQWLYVNYVSINLFKCL